MARKKKQLDLKTLNEETQKALSKLKEEMQKKSHNVIAASKDLMALSMVQYEDGEMELVIKGHKNFSNTLSTLISKGIWLALIIESLPENLKEDYIDQLLEAENNILMDIKTRLPKNVVEDIDKKINNLI